jgi:preprotein translocase subunit YajC|tara:strand:- start:442 stop:621 length:180 start_codon:yes stop_codon:yes gene_type:complete
MDALIKKGTNVEFTLSGNTGTVTAIGNKTVSITNSKGENFKLPHAEVNRMVDAKSLKKI